MESPAPAALENFSSASLTSAASHKNPFAIQELLGLNSDHQSNDNSSNAASKDYKFHHAQAAAAVSAAAAAALAQSSVSFSNNGNSKTSNLFSDSYSAVSAAAAAGLAAGAAPRMYLNSGVLSPSGGGAGAAGNAFSPASFPGIPHFFHVDANKQDPYGKI